MRSQNKRAGRLTLGAALLAGTALVALPTVASAQESAQPSGIADIVVTAQKREQNLQDVPISITAINAEAIAANRIQDVRDLSAVAPNLTVRVASGGSQQPNYTLRGILTGGSAAGSDKGVSLYIDGVYIQNVQGSIFEFADIERIEVLKGPQGTLFGRNATGGAISIITRNPTGEFGVRQELTYGNLDQIRAKTRVDLPQIGPFSATFNYLHSERRGDVKNLGAGTVWDHGPATGGKVGKLKSPKWLGGDNTEAFAAAVKADLHPDLDLIYKFDYAENDFVPNAQGVGYLPDGFVKQLSENSPNPQTPVTNKRPKAVNNWFHTMGQSKGWGHNLTAQFRASDTVSFKNILAYRKSKVYANFQLDGLGGLVNGPIDLGGGFIVPAGFLPSFPPRSAVTLADGTPGVPFLYLGNNVGHNEKQWSNEFQINIDTDWFNLTAGYLHFQDKVKTAGVPGEFNTLITMTANGQQTNTPGVPFVIPGNPNYNLTRVKVISDAVFVQPEIHLTDQLDLVLGARITRDKKSGLEYLPDQVTLGGTAANPITSPIKYRRTHATYLAGVNYRPTDNILTYAKFATGYISGGQLATITFEPETAKSWEAGIKADLFDRRFRSNLSVFSVKYKNIQYTTSGQLTGVASSFQFSQAVIASADGKAKGFEWENTFLPMEGLTLQANVGYTDLKFDDDSIFPGFVTQSGAPGYQEFQRPDWTGNLSAQYETPEMVRGGRLVLRADGNFRSKFLHTSDTSPGSGVNAPEDPVLRKAATTGFQWIVNGRIALQDMDIGGTKAFVALWGRNIFDNKNITQFTGLGPVASVIYERARTYGIDVGFEF